MNSSSCGTISALGTKNGLALFSMTIRDANGDVLTSILDNEWVVYQDRVNDWNFSENILEVIDSKNDVLFQVELNGNEIRFAGKTYQKNGSGPISFVPLLARCDHGVDGTIFQYPRNRHHGEKKIYA